ncbi:MAG: hypothetical protein Q8S33_15080 [Myxococcales bacterium]|nr:hypothetical protein [Myxococcales bacterium]
MTAALAKLAAKRGKRVLVTEVGDEGDDYSPLARHWNRERLPKHPEPLETNIHGAVLLARTGQELFLKSVLRSGTIARAALSSDALRRLLSAGPSFREMGVFFQLLMALREKTGTNPTHELILIDMPATGHTLSLTGLPELLLKLVPGGPIAAALKEGQTYLNDPKLAAAWIVTLPETLPVSECLELIDGLKKTKMPVGGVVVNRMPADPFTRAEREALAPLVDQHAWLGRELFKKPIVAHRELARLRSHTALPLFVTPELPHEGLIASLTTLLDDANPLPMPSGGA